MGFRVLLSLLVLASCLMINAHDLGHVSWTQAPHHAPSYSPIGAPKPHHGHHNGPGGHHHKPAVPVHPPVKAPVHPPVKTPVQAPTKSPVYAPTIAPVHPPVKAPVYPPSVAPVHPPVPSRAPPPARKHVAVRGMVYCKACKYKGIDTLTEATPLAGAVVLLTCYNTKYPLRVKGITDLNGFFFIMPPKTLTTYGVHKCKVTLLKSSNPKCKHPTNLHYGVKGATLVPSPKPKPSGSILPMPKLPFDVYTVGPFAYEPSKKTPCPIKA